ncbi:MAG: hypothetical protein N2234_06765 [Planctomycetota bacterium]|nr:hypothetical protein [Planctomycetota bacterium]
MEEKGEETKNTSIKIKSGFPTSVAVCAAVALTGIGFVALVLVMMQMYDEETFLPLQCFSPKESERWDALHNYKSSKPSALKALKEILRKDSSSLVRAEALACICRNFPNSAVSAIKEAYSFGDTFLRCEALYLADAYRLEHSLKDVIKDALKSDHKELAAFGERIVKRFSESERNRLFAQE